MNGYIAELFIPPNARRSSAYDRKCRCDKALVLDIQNPDGSPSGKTSCPSIHDKDFIYTIGETVTADNFDEDRWNECSTGIHFFITRQEAVDY